MCTKVSSEGFGDYEFEIFYDLESFPRCARTGPNKSASGGFEGAGRQYYNAKDGSRVYFDYRDIDLVVIEVDSGIRGYYEIATETLLDVHERPTTAEDIVSSYIEWALNYTDLDERIALVMSQSQSHQLGVAEGSAPPLGHDDFSELASGLAPVLAKFVNRP